MSPTGPTPVRTETGRISWAVRAALPVLVALALTAAGCSGSDGGSPVTPKSAPTTADPGPGLPRYRTDGLRLEVSPTRPLVIYNVYPTGAQPELVDEVVALWPEDLLPYLAIQVVPNGMDHLSPAEKSAAVDSMLTATDKARVPAILQTLTLFGNEGPDDAAVDAAFDAHPSLVGIGVAELSAAFAASVGGLQDDQRAELAKRIEQAGRHRGLLLWADMGYLGPQVFVDAGADPVLYPLMRRYRDNIIVQVKQNGLGRRFGTQSAAFGMYLSGLAGAWGINSEDWLWWEASLQRLGDPQVPGGLEATGMVRSPYQLRARLTYPEALFGTEMLLVAASGGSVFSIEAPERGTVDPAGTAGISPAGQNVVFPVLRRLIRGHLIPDRSAVESRVKLALHPATRDDPALATDRVFSLLYGPDGCTDADRLSCAQRQWLPSTGRYGIVPTLPALADADVVSRFPAVMTPSEALEAGTAPVQEKATVSDSGTGDSWAVPAVGADTWFVANPNENEDERSTFELPALARTGHVRLGGDLGRHTFVMLDGRAGLSLLVDNYRTDSDRLWDENISEEALAKLPLDEVGTAPPDTTTLTFTYPTGTHRPELKVSGATADQKWDAGSARLTLTFAHRGPVEITSR